LPTFWDNLPSHFQGLSKKNIQNKSAQQMGPTDCPETSVATNLGPAHPRRRDLYCGGSLILRTFTDALSFWNLTRLISYNSKTETMCSRVPLSGTYLVTLPGNIDRNCHDHRSTKTTARYLPDKKNVY